MTLHQLIAAFAVAMHQSGAPSHVLERHVDGLLSAYGAEGTSLASPTAVWLQVGERAQVLRLAPGGVDLAKLAALLQWHDQVLAESPPLADAGRTLSAIAARAPVWSTRAQAVAFVLGSGAAGALFGGTTADALLSTLGAAGVWWGTGRLSDASWTPIRPILLSAGAGALGALGGALGASPVAVAVASVLALLPGLSLTLAVAEVAEGQLQSGAARLLGAVSTAVQLAVGLAVGASLGAYVPGATTSTALPAAVIAAVPLVAPLTFAVLLGVRPRDLSPVVVVSALAFLVATALGGAVGAAVAGLGVGLAANAIARARRIPSLVTSVPGLLLLVPGAMGVRGVGLLLEDDLLGGAQTALSALGVSGALAAGLLTAHALLPVAPSPRPMRLRTTEPSLQP